jgi:hypothetical protein
MAKLRIGVIILVIFFFLSNFIAISRMIPPSFGIPLAIFSYIAFFGFVIYEAIIVETIKNKKLKSELKETIASHDIVLVESILKHKTLDTAEYELVPSRIDIYMKDRKLTAKAGISVNGKMDILIVDKMNSWKISAVPGQRGYIITFKDSKDKILGTREAGLGKMKLRNIDYEFFKDEKSEQMKTDGLVFSTRTFNDKIDRLSFIDFSEKPGFEKQMDAVLISISNYFYIQENGWTKLN